MEVKKLSPFDIIKSINEKQYIVFDRDNEKQYTAFVVNRGLSQNLDCVPYVFKMNILHMLPNKMQYDYLYYGIRKSKRFGGWAKESKYDNLDDIIDYYKCSKQKALNILDRLTDEQVGVIVRRASQTGGLKKRINKTN